MPLRLNDVNGDASVACYGFKATSRSLKPVHLAHVIFGHTQQTIRSPERLFKFCEKPTSTPSSELDDAFDDLFESTRDLTDERMDQLRSAMRRVLANDNALYNSQRGSAPTCTSDYFVINPTAGVTPGRFIYTLMSRSGGDIEDKLRLQLHDHHDAISLLFRPLVRGAEESSATVRQWEEPELGAAFGTGRIADSFVEGYDTLEGHLKTSSGTAGVNFPRDLRRVVKFGCFAFYLYMINRHTEIAAPRDRHTRVPLVLNYTGGTDNPVADASLNSVRLALSEIEQTARVGITHVLDRDGYRDYSENEIRELIDDVALLDVRRKTDEKEQEDHQDFLSIFEADRAADTFERFANAVSDAINHSSSQFKTYTPQKTAETFAWRAGLVKPRGNRANKRRYRPDPEIIEAVVLSVLEPDQALSLGAFCEELRVRYGIIVGGTRDDRPHLDAWDIQLGASTTERDPLKNRNYEGFKQMLVDLGFAQEYADGVTIVSGGDVA
jgi:hypothetical protein